MNRTIILIAASSALCLGGCAVVTNENVHDTVEATHDHVTMSVSPRYRSIAVLPFFNETGTATAGPFARRSFFGVLAAYKNYDLLPMKKTDKILETLPNAAHDPKEFKQLGEALKTDLIAFGWALEQTHSFGVVYNKNSVRARVVFVDTKTGAFVFDSSDTRSRTLVGFSMVTMIEDEYMWAREVANRYDELFRDMMPELPDRILK